MNVLVTLEAYCSGDPGVEWEKESRVSELKSKRISEQVGGARGGTGSKRVEPGRYCEQVGGAGRYSRAGGGGYGSRAALVSGIDWCCKIQVLCSVMSFM